ncbi:MAG: hypothetical protein JRJ66_02775 [Deltaproteobacteria bacterium]|nr:hypothetical protein [Deltaproteobacteria bacterium]
MTKKDLETQAKKAVLKIEEKVTDIKNLMSDMSMKLCYIIKDKRDPYEIYRDMLEGNEYSK